MVCGYPKQAFRIVTDLPYKNILRHILKALGLHQFCERGVPSFLGPHVDISTCRMGNHPDILFFIDCYPIVIIGIEGTFDIIFLPHHFPTFPIDAHQFAIGGDEDHTLCTLCIGRHAKFLVKLIRSIAKWNMVEFLRFRIKVIKTILISLDPVILLRVEVKALNSALDTLLIKPTTRVTIHLLRPWVIKGIVHALFQPKQTIMRFLYLINTIVAECGGVLIV